MESRAAPNILPSVQNFSPPGGSTCDLVSKRLLYLEHKSFLIKNSVIKTA
jgi:hypothetical protein